MREKYVVGFLCCLSLLLVGCGNPVSTHSVVYDGNGSTAGAVPSDVNQYANGQTATILGNSGVLARSTFRFSGWNTEPDGSGTGKLPGAVLRMGSADIILYARWGTDFTVVYYGNGSTGGTVPVDGNGYSSGQRATILGNPGSLVKAGCTFAGWNTEADGSGSARMPGASFAIGSASLTLYAQWMAKASYQVSYDGNGQTSGSVPTDPARYLPDAAVTVLGNTGTLAKTGYVFAAWNTRADGTGSTRTSGTRFTMLPENVVLYAQWRPYAVGDAGPAGGLVFYDKGSYSDGWRYMEAASTDQGTGFVGGIPGTTTSSDVGSGKANTFYFQHAFHLNIDCIRASTELVSGGYSDWFLPSLDELNLMFTNLQVNALGGFSLGVYWSSTALTTTTLSAIDFNSGKQVLTKDTYRVRAARTF